MEELDALFCEQCGQEIEGDDYYIVPEWGTGWPIVICEECYYDGPPEPVEWAAQPREV